MIYKLLIEDDEGQTTDVPLIRNQISIGRSEENTICLRERNVSRKHADITLESGQIFITDLQSFNGVWVNGELIKDPTLIKPGDLIEVGDYHLSLRLDKDDGVDNAVPSLPPDVEPVSSATSEGLETVRVAVDGLDNEPVQGGRLVLLNTKTAGQEFTLSDSEMTIGRKDEGNDLEIDHPSVSRVHAKLSFTGSSYRLVDQNSANGIRINGEDHDSCDLRWGDIIELGTVQLQLLAPGDPSPVTSTRPEIKSTARSASTKVSTSSAPTAPAPVLDADEEDAGSPVMIVGIAALVLILGVGGFFAFYNPSGSGASKKEGAATDAAVARKAPDKPPARRELSDEERLVAAKKAILEGSFDKAASALKKLLLKRTDWKEPQKLLNTISEEKPRFELLKKAALLRTDNKMDSLKKALKTLKGFPEKSLFAQKAKAVSTEIRSAMVKQLQAKTEKLISEKKYYVALQVNNEALELDANNAKTKALHKKLEQLTSGTPPTTRNDTPEPDNRLPMRVSPTRRSPARTEPPKNRDAGPQ